MTVPQGVTLEIRQSGVALLGNSQLLHCAVTPCLDEFQTVTRARWIKSEVPLIKSVMNAQPLQSDKVYKRGFDAVEQTQ